MIISPLFEKSAKNNIETAEMLINEIISYLEKLIRDKHEHRN